MERDVETYRDEVGRIWILAVLEEYHRLAAATPCLRRISLPHFCIEDRMGPVLGSWHPVSRRLTLAAALFADCDWEQVVTTLKHELAHLLVSDYFRVQDEPPHGPTFRRACVLLGISPEARARLPMAGGKAHPVIGRIHKLLALGESPNRHEAELALSKAHELMLKYNVSLVGAEAPGGYAFRFVGPLFRRVPAYLWEITRVLCDYYFVDYICRPFRVPGEERCQRAIELYGTPANLDMAEYVYYFLLQQAEVQWQRYRAANGPSAPGRHKLSFLRGLYRGVGERLGGERAQLQQQEALVWVGDPGLTAFYQQRNPAVRRTKSLVRHDAVAHQAGREAGSKLRIRQGITGASRAAAPRGLLN